MEVERVERHIIKTTHSLYKYCDQMCLKSKNLYNLANYYIRQIFIALSKEQRSQEQQQLIEEINSQIPSFNKRRKENFNKKKEKNPTKYAKRVFKPMSLLGDKHKYLGYDFLDFFMRGYEDYQVLPQQTAQQTLRLLNKNWKAFFESIKDYKKQPSKYTGRPNLPKYKKKNGRQIAIFTNQQCKLLQNFIRFPRTNLNLQTTIKGGFQQVRIVPKDTCYIVEVVYKKTAQDVYITSERRILGIDLGVDNFATCVNNIGLDPFIINGKDLKSINQYYNKKKALLM